MTSRFYAILRNAGYAGNLLTDALNNICAKLNCNIWTMATLVSNEPNSENEVGHALE